MSTKNTVTFELPKPLADAIEKLQKSGETIKIEIDGHIDGENLVINKLESFSTGARAAPHCWHAVSDKHSASD
ncbi:hypothetical protein [Pseudophaeobacter sp.]|jgi:hypothetical protein|uniref:Pyruvate carboxyltransferase domain-containing protein n=1 Tax=Pseudophaeobacter arcticus TaxID=385492 RepID=A0ABQ0AS76_9RHOB|nr:hypothetical protein [uncultured Pseudophaeobacter sp.]